MGCGSSSKRYATTKDNGLNGTVRPTGKLLAETAPVQKKAPDAHKGQAVPSKEPVHEVVRGEALPSPGGPSASSAAKAERQRKLHQDHSEALPHLPKSPSAAQSPVTVPGSVPTRRQADGATKGDAVDQFWSGQEDWIRHRSTEILAAYNCFFEHIGIRKGWRTAPFCREEVQVPFQSAAEVVTVVRAKLDEEKGSGVILRQLEGSAMDFFWGWNPERPPGGSAQARVDFFHGLVVATLSDGRGFVEGLDLVTVEYYVSCHPLMAGAHVSPQVETVPGTADKAEGHADSRKVSGTMPDEGESTPKRLQRKRQENHVLSSETSNVIALGDGPVAVAVIDASEDMHPAIEAVAGTGAAEASDPAAESEDELRQAAAVAEPAAPLGTSMAIAISSAASAAPASGMALAIAN